MLIHDLLQAHPAVPSPLLWLALLLLLKFALNIACYACAVPGGIFAPILSQGALLGFLVGVAVSHLGAVPLSAAAVIAMAAYFAAVVQAPLTGTILIIEMTGNYDLLFALMVACMIAYFVAQAFGARPVYEALLRANLRTDRNELARLKEPHLIDIVVEPHSTMDGKRLSEIPLPRGTLVITVCRGGMEMVPSGETYLAAGDELTLVVSGDITQAAASIRENAASGH